MSYLLVLAQTHCLDFSFERELSNYFVLMVIPQHNLIWRKLWIMATSDKRKNVAAEEHFGDADPSLQICSNVNN